MKVGIWLLVFLVVISIASATTYNIASCVNATNSLANLSNDLSPSAVYNIMQNISCSGISMCFTPTGSTAATVPYFTIHGLNHTISDVYCVPSSGTGSALFGGVQWEGGYNEHFNGTIDHLMFRNVTVIHTNIGDASGFLFGGCGDATFEQVGIVGTWNISGAGNNVGGLCGYVNNKHVAINNVFVNITQNGLGGRHGQICGNGGNGCFIVNSYVSGYGTGDSCWQDFANENQINDSFCLMASMNDLGKGVCGGTTGCWYDINYSAGMGAAAVSGDVNYYINWATPTWVTAADKASNDPMSAWSTGIWKLDYVGLPIFVWDYTERDTTPPQFALYQNVTTVELGHSGQLWVNWSDNKGVMDIIWSTWNTTHWDNTSFDIDNVSFYTITDDLEFNIIGNWSFKSWAMDNSSNWNMSFPLQNVTVTAIPTYPKFEYFSQNTTGLYRGGGVYHVVRWSDTNNLSIITRQLWNTSIWTNVSYLANIQPCTVNFTNCTSAWSITPDVPGNWSWKFYVNNSQNNWNTSEIFNVTVYDLYPQFYYYYQNATVASRGGIVIQQVNWSTQFPTSMVSNLSFITKTIWNSTGFVSNTTVAVGLSYSPCAINYTDCKYVGLPILDTPGNWSIRWSANNTFNNWNTSAMLNITVYDVFPNIVNTTINTTAINLGGTIAWRANMSSYRKLSIPIRSIWNTSHWINYTSDFQYCETGNLSCMTFLYQTTPTIEGNWSFKWYINNTYNNWNTSNTFNVTVTRVNHIDLLTQSISAWNVTVTYTANFSTTYSSPNYYWVGEIFPNGTRINYTAYSSWTANTSDWGYITITSTPTPVGLHSIRIYANDTYGAQNSTDWLNVTVPNGGAQITDWKIRPCVIDADGNQIAWRRSNPTILLQVLIVDIPVAPYYTVDVVQSRIKAYNGTGVIYDTSDWVNGTSNHWANWTISNNSLNDAANGTINTIANGTLQVDVRDIVNLTISSINITYLFTDVGGMVQWECMTSMGDYVVAEETRIEPTPVDSIAEMFATLAGLTNVTGMILWMILTVCLIGVVWYYMHSQPMAATIATLFVIFGFTFMGYFIGALPFNLFIVVIIFGIVGVVLLLTSAFRGKD